VAATRAPAAVAAVLDRMAAVVLPADGRRALQAAAAARCRGPAVVGVRTDDVAAAVGRAVVAAGWGGAAASAVRLVGAAVHPRWPALTAAATTAMYAGHTPPSPFAPPCDGPSPLSRLVCALLRVPDAGALDALVAAAAALSAASAFVPALLADPAVRGAAAEAAAAAASPVAGAAAPVLLRHSFPTLIHGRLIAVTAAAAAVVAAASSVDPWAMPAAAAR